MLNSDTNSECEFHAHLNSSWSLTLKVFTTFVVNLFFQHRVPIFLCFKDQKLAHLKLKYYIRGPPAKSLVKSRRSTQKSDSFLENMKNSARNSGKLLLRPINLDWILQNLGRFDHYSWMTSGSGSQKYSRFAYLCSLSILIFIPQLKGYLKTTFPCNTLECVLSAALTVDEYIKSSFLPHFLFSCQLSGQKRLVNSLIVVIELIT